MNCIVKLETKRLKLRQWQACDFPVFAQMNADPEVMKYYPNVLSENESYLLASKLKALISERSWGFWAVEIKQTEQFIGFVGLHKPTYDLPVSSCVEIGWRLGKNYWGKGYATEAAREVLRFAFEILKLHEVYSFTSVVNVKSQSVMKRLKMEKTGDHFDHPIIPENNPLREHVLYKLAAAQWHMNTE